MKYCILTLVFIFIVELLHSQDISLGLQNGITVSSVSFKYPDSFQFESYSFGFFAEYVPPKALFALSTEAHYLFDDNMLLLPLSLNVVIGNRIRPRIIGGFVPVFRFKPIYPDKAFGIGVNYGFGIDIRVTPLFIIHSQLIWYRIPYKSVYDKYNANEINTNWWPRAMFRLGLSYKIK